MYSVMVCCVCVLDYTVRDALVVECCTYATNNYLSLKTCSTCFQRPFVTMTRLSNMHVHIMYTVCIYDRTNYVYECCVCSNAKHLWLVSVTM